MTAARKAGRSVRPARPGRAAALALVALLSVTADAAAHRRDAGSDGARRGVVLPAVSHGEMRVLAAHRGAIVDLAARQTATNETFRRILNFANIQFAYCLWGLAPGAVTDDRSPFNECAHAYLSAAKALLAEMDGVAEARALASAIGRELAATQPVSCQFSDEPFDTARTVYPDWGMARGHGPTLAALLALLMMGFGAVLALRGLSRGATPPTDPSLRSA